VAAIPVHLLSAHEKGLPPDLELAANLYLPSGQAPDQALPAPGLVVGHGAGSRASRHEEFCLAACRQGFAVLALDFRGHGDSAGSGDGPLELDILAAARFLREYPAVDPLSICYRGSSMGGFYGLKAAPEAGFTALVLLCSAGEDTMLAAIRQDGFAEAPPDTEAQDDPQHRAEAPQNAMTRWDTPRLRTYFELQDSRSLAARIDRPVLLIHARGDKQVPFEHSLTLARHLRGDTTLVALAGGSHTTTQHDPAMHSYSLAWLWERIEEARARRG
jgi:dipeptidyl aminopeptidase/acylaminoacyl peptidase